MLQLGRARLPRCCLNFITTSKLRNFATLNTVKMAQGYAEGRVRSDYSAFANTNFGTSGASGLYDRARPTYPREAIDSLLTQLPPNAVVVELGAGTGLFTRGLLAAAAEKPGTVKSLLAVEPSEGMRVGFEKGLEALGEIETSIVEGAFERIPVADHSVDLAFHWVGHSGDAAVAEIARVLKPEGVWAKVWNLEDDETEWVKEVRRVYEAFEAGTPQYRLGYWKHIWDLPSFTSSFAPEQYALFHQSLPTTEDLVVDRCFSKSYITALAGEDKKKVEQGIREAVREGTGKKWIKKEEGTFEYPYKTDLFVTKRK
ncbi:hypothetical protein JCM11641_000407 [Rhodosporidiobolus odoratus]